MSDCLQVGRNIPQLVRRVAHVGVLELARQHGVRVEAVRRAAVAARGGGRRPAPQDGVALQVRARAAPHRVHHRVPLGGGRDRSRCHVLQQKPNV